MQRLIDNLPVDKREREIALEGAKSALIELYEWMPEQGYGINEAMFDDKLGAMLKEVNKELGE